MPKASPCCVKCWEENQKGDGGARCRGVRSSLSDGKKSERALLDSPKMECQAGECRTFFFPVPRKRASQLATGEVRRVGPQWWSPGLFK